MFSKPPVLKQIVFLCLFVFTALNSKAQWQQIDLFSGGVVFTIERVGVELWAGTTLGIYKSVDEGNSWELSEDLMNKKIERIESYNDTVNVFYLNRDLPFGVLYCKTSFDAGLSWSDEFSFPETNQTYSYYKVGNILYVIGDLTSYSSSNFGLSWGIYVNNNFENPEIYFFNEYGYIFKSGGNSFYYKDLQSGDETPINSQGLAIGTDMCIINNEIYVAYENAQTITWHLIKTADFGQNWDTVLALNGVGFNSTFTEFNDTTYFYDDFANQTVKIYNNGQIVEFGNIPDLIVYLGGNYKPNDNYEVLLNGNYISPNFNSTSSLPRLYDTNLSYINTIGTGFNNINIVKFKQENNKIWVSKNDGTYLSNDEMISWDTIPNVGLCYSSIIKGDSIILTTANNYEKYLTTSFDGGLTWTNNVFPSIIDISLSSYPSELTLVELNNILYLESGHQIVKSTDWGTTWQALPEWPATFNGILHNGLEKGSLLKVGNEIFLAASNTALVLKLNTINDTWEFVAGFDEQFYLNFQDHLLQYSDSILFSNSYEHFMYSENLGEDWIYPSMHGVPFRDIYDTIYPKYVLVDSNIWYGTFREFGVYYSLDNGNNWISLQNPNPFDADGGLVMVDDILYSGSRNGGLWRKSNELNISSGSVFVDSNFNGIRDNNENGVPNILVKASSSNTMVSTNSDGNFQILTQIGNDTLKPELSLNYAEILPQQIVTISAQNNCNFAVQLSPFNDLSVGLTALNVFRPGFNTYLQIAAQNLGSTSNPATIKLQLPQEVSLVNSNPNFSFQSGDTLIWTLPNLDFYENYAIQLTVTSSLSANLGDSVICYTEISPISSDSFPSNNTFTLHDFYVGSFDPNDKQCLQGSNVPIDNLNSNFELQYTIRFQNTGTFEAENVRIEDQISPLLKWETLRIIDQSHDSLSYEINDGGLLKFHFNHIQLPDSFANEPASHGFIKYGIKPISQLDIGNTISNTAAIFFDFNEPVITNTVFTEISDYPLVLKPIKIANLASEIITIPNPAISYVQLVSGSNTMLNKSYIIYDAYGREVLNNTLSNKEPIIQIQQLSSGLYFGVLLDQTSLVSGRFKFVKQ